MQTITLIYRASSWCNGHGLKPLSRVLDGIGRILFAASVPGRAKIGKNVFFHHSGLGVVINGASVIGDDCEIGVQVVLGGRSPKPGAPELGEHVIVHAGAKIIGPIKIGAGSIIAANAVVIEDVPPRCLVAGVPGQVKRSDIDSAAYIHNSLPF